MSKITFECLFGSIFAGIGGIFAVIGLIMTANIEALMASPNSQGDVRILPIIFTGLGLVFVAIGVPFLVIGIKKSRNKKRVISEGNYIYAKVVEIRPNYSVRINGRHPYVAVCEYVDPYGGGVHVFTSDNMMYCPETALDTEVRVYVDRNNYGIYAVDTSSIEGNVHIH